MDRSLRKTISFNDLKKFFQSNNIPEDKQSSLILELFDNPQNKKLFLLKSDIRTLKDLETNIRRVIDNQDCIYAIVESFSVKDDLVIPDELKEVLYSNQKLAFFVGAGVSKLLDIPLWDELASSAIKYLNDKNYINHVEADRLQNERYTSKQIMSIFHQFVKKKDEIKTFYEDQLKDKKKDSNPYELLFQIEKALAKPILKVSTNFDLQWEKVLKDKYDKQKQEQDREGRIANAQLFYTDTKSSNFTNDQKIEEHILHHIHGILHNLDNAIITTSQYVHNYQDDKGLRGFLKNVFTEYTVLFLGSGIQEFEILEHCLKPSPISHYALIGTRMGEENLFRIKKSYFKEIKIKPIPYYLDFQGHNRLLFVLQSWVDEITFYKKNQFYNNIKMIDEVL